MVEYHGCEEVSVDGAAYDIIRPSGDESNYRVLGPPGADLQPVVTVGPGETLENKLVDAPVGLEGHGDGWVIRNIGIRGGWGSGDHTAIAPYCPGGSDEGLIENVYFGEGASQRCSGAKGVWVAASGGREHNGHITFRRLHVRQFCDNGVYCSGPASKGQSGTVTIEDSYGYHNNITNFRVSREGDVIRNCVVDVSNPSEVPTYVGNGQNGRSFWAVDGDGSRALVENCRTVNPRWWGAEANQGSCMEVRDSCIDADIGGCASETNVSRSGCDLSPPSGVPMSAEEAANGGGGGPCDGVTCPPGQHCEGGECVPDDDGDPPEGVPGDPETTRSMTVTGPSGTSSAFYRFEVSPSQSGTPGIEKTGEAGPGADPDDDVFQADNGNWVCEGGAALSGTDTYDVTGYFRGFESQGSYSFGVQVNGQSVDPGGLMEEPSAALRAAFSVGGSGLTVELDASDSEGDIESYAWDFGDGSSGAGRTASHTYDDAGEYDVTLTVTSPGGSKAETTETVSVSVNGQPQPSPGRFSRSALAALGSGVGTVALEQLLR